MADMHGFKHQNWLAGTVVSSADGALITEGDGNYFVNASGNGDTIILGNGNQVVWASGAGDSITLGNGNQMVSVSNTNDTITIGNTTGMSLVKSSAGIAVITGGNGNIGVCAQGDDNTVVLGDGHDTVQSSGSRNRILVGSSSGTNDVNSVTTGGESTVILGAGRNTVKAGGEANSITTGDGVQCITASGSYNDITIGNTSPTGIAGHGEGFDDGCGDDGGDGGNSSNTIRTDDSTQCFTASGSYNDTSTGNTSSTAIGGQGEGFDDGCSPYGDDSSGTGTIRTGDSTQCFTASGSCNDISTGDNSSTAIAGDGEGFDDGCSPCGDGSINTSTIRTGDFAWVQAGDGNVSVTASGGNDYVQAGTGNDSIFLLGATNAGFNTVILGSGQNKVFLTGEHNTVIEGSGSTCITAGSGNDVFIVNAAGGATTIDNFQATDHLVLSALLQGNVNDLVLTTQADTRFGSGAVDTEITATGSSGTAHVTLTNFDGGSAMAMLSAKMLSA